MHEFGSAYDFAAIKLSDALVSKADPEYRSMTGEPFNGGERHPGIVGGSRPGRNQDPIGIEFNQFVDGLGVVADHDRLHSQLAQVLNQDVDEGIVVVDDQQSRFHEGRLPVGQRLGGGFRTRYSDGVVRQDKTKSGRVTRKPEDSARVSREPVKVGGRFPNLVPIMMFLLMGVGLLVIMLNYVVIGFGAPSNWYLLGGLGLILAGIVAATQYR